MHTTLQRILFRLQTIPIRCELYLLHSHHMLRSTGWWRRVSTSFTIDHYC